MFGNVYKQFERFVSGIPQVVCSKCSSFKASLAYECGKSVRVCRTCHATLQELSSSTATPSPEIDEGDECSVYSAKDHLDLPFRSRGVLEVSARNILSLCIRFSLFC